MKGFMERLFDHCFLDATEQYFPNFKVLGIPWENCENAYADTIGLSL
jgi:hypothetical protein